MRVFSLCLLLALPVPAFAQVSVDFGSADRVLQIVGGGSQIGVSVAEVQPADVARYKLQGQQGAIVTGVSTGMPAEKAGIKSGDVIVEFDGQAVRSVSQLTRLIRETPAGRTVGLAVMRDGRRIDLTVTPREGVTARELVGDLEERLRQMLRDREAPPAPQNPLPWVLPRPDVPSERQQVPRWDIGPFGTTSQIGISMRDLESGDVTRYKLPGQQGVLVTEVYARTPAEQAGVRKDDVIVEFDGERVRSASHLQRLIRESMPGRAVKMVVVRDAKRIELSVTPQVDSAWPVPGSPGLLAPTYPPRPYGYPRNDRAVPVPPLLGGRAVLLGIGVQDLTPQLAEYFGTREGVLVGSVTDNSPASRAGVKAGDVITAIDGKPVRQSADVRAALAGKRAGDQVKLDLMRDRKPLALAVTFGPKRQNEIESN